MKFVLYDYAVSLIPEGAWRQFGDNLAKFGELLTFWRQMNVLKILCPESERLIGSVILQITPESLAKL